jgi:hypothetical protein
MAVVVPPAPAVVAPQQLVVLDDEAVTLKRGNSTAHKQMLAVCKKALAGWEQVTAADVEASSSCIRSGEKAAKQDPAAHTRVPCLAVQHCKRWPHECECQIDTTGRAGLGTCYGQSVWREDRADHRQERRASDSSGSRGTGLWPSGVCKDRQQQARQLPSARLGCSADGHGRTAVDQHTASN